MSPANNGGWFRDATRSEPFGPFLVDAFTAGQRETGGSIKDNQSVIPRSRKLDKSTNYNDASSMVKLNFLIRWENLL